LLISKFLHSIKLRKLTLRKKQEKLERGLKRVKKENLTWELTVQDIGEKGGSSRNGGFDPRGGGKALVSPGGEQFLRTKILSQKRKEGGAVQKEKPGSTISGRQKKERGYIVVGPRKKYRSRSVAYHNKRNK